MKYKAVHIFQLVIDIAMAVLCIIMMCANERVHAGLLLMWVAIATIAHLTIAQKDK